MTATAPARPPQLQAVPAAVRDHVPGFCSRCDQPAMLLMCPGVDALCGRCRAAERHDRLTATYQAGCHR